MESDSGNANEFMTQAVGPPGLFGVFEDDGETGYLYLYEPGGRKVFRHLQIYDRTTNLPVQQKDVQVVWSDDFSKVGVRNWGRMRGIINLATGQEGRVWLESRNSPGIDDAEWLRGLPPS